jgi:excinuclease ABC subunit C
MECDANCTAIEFDCDTGFGPSALMPRRRVCRRLAIGDDFSAMRRAVRSECPGTAGVYGLLDREGRLIYVGVSSRLRKRLATYFQTGEAHRKERRVARQASEVVWEEIGHELVAQLRELELIRRHEPRLNVRGRERPRALGYIYLSGEVAPRFRVGRQAPAAARQAWGPLAVGRRIREAVEFVNAEFKLCDCPKSVAMRFADQPMLFEPALRVGCLRGEIGTCLGPCAGLCSRREYAGQWRSAQAFLDGADDGVLDRLEERMEAAAGRRNYELAARMRDRLDRLQLLSRELAALRTPTFRNCVYPLRFGRRRLWLLIASASVVRGMSEPISKVSAARGLRRIGSVFADEGSQSIVIDRATAAVGAAWFRAHPGEAAAIMSPDAAREQCLRVLELRR